MLGAEAQVNLKIGYESALISSEQNKRVVNAFNELNRETLEQGMLLAPLRLTHGLTIGVAYKRDFMRLSANWHSSSRRKVAFGEVPGTGDSFDRSIRHTVRGFSLQYELIFGRFSLGVAPGRDNFRTTSLIGGTNNDLRIIDEDVFNVRFNLGFKLITSNKASVYIEPYYTLLLDDVNHTGEYEFFDIPDIPSNVVDRPHYFGIQFTFHNGPQ